MQETHLDIKESVVALRDDLKNLTLDLARLYKEHRDIACVPALPDSAVGILEQSEALLGEVMPATSDGEPAALKAAALELEARGLPAPALAALGLAAPQPAALAPGAPEAAAPAKRARRGSHASKGRTQR